MSKEQCQNKVTILSDSFKCTHTMTPSHCMSTPISTKRSLFEQKLIYLSLVLYADTVPKL